MSNPTNTNPIQAARSLAIWTHRELTEFHWTSSDTTPDELVAACNTLCDLQGIDGVHNYNEALSMASCL